jgi:hypothetical protein
MERSLDARRPSIERSNRTLGIKPARHLALVEPQEGHDA